MKQQGIFFLLSPDEFILWLDGLRAVQKIKPIQNHRMEFAKTRRCGSSAKEKKQGVWAVRLWTSEPIIVYLKNTNAAYHPGGTADQLKPRLQ